MLRGFWMRPLFAGVVLAWAAAAQAADPAAAPAPGAEWSVAHGEARRVLEELRSEVEVMKRIVAAQTELMAWNEERARIGLVAVTLRPELCLEEEIRRWCRLLPATFGVAEGRP